MEGLRTGATLRSSRKEVDDGRDGELANQRRKLRARSKELNLSNDATLDFVVVRSDNERIALDLDIVPAEQSGKS